MHHSYANLAARSNRTLTEEERREYPDVFHPLVRRHPADGRKALWGLSTTTPNGIVDMPNPAGKELIRQLMEFATQEQFVYRHKWRSRTSSCGTIDARCIAARRSTRENTSASSIVHGYEARNRSERWRAPDGGCGSAMCSSELEDLLMTLSIEAIKLETRPLMPAFGVEIFIDIGGPRDPFRNSDSSFSARRHIDARSVSRPGGANRFHEGLRHTGRKRLSGMVRPGLSGDLYNLEQSREWPQDRRSRPRHELAH